MTPREEFAGGSSPFPQFKCRQADSSRVSQVTDTRLVIMDAKPQLDIPNTGTEKDGTP
jgi:hypothetical protein